MASETEKIEHQVPKKRPYKPVKRPPQYPIWASMVARCYNPKLKPYKNYGGRGITVCDEWRHSYKKFMEDMGPCPPGYTLERVNNSGNYEPSNCVWANRKAQCRNTRDNHFLTFNGETKTMVEWAEIIGINYITLRSRIYTGWSTEDALTIPAGAGRPGIKGGPRPKQERKEAA